MDPRWSAESRRAAEDRDLPADEPNRKAHAGPTSNHRGPVPRGDDDALRGDGAPAAEPNACDVAPPDANLGDLTTLDHGRAKAAGALREADRRRNRVRVPRVRIAQEARVVPGVQAGFNLHGFVGTEPLHPHALGSEEIQELLECGHVLFPGAREKARPPKVAGEPGLLLEAREDREAIPREPDPDARLVVPTDDRPAVARRPRADVPSLEEGHAQAPAGEMERDTRAHAPAAHDDGVRAAGDARGAHGQANSGSYIEVSRGDSVLRIRGEKREQTIKSRRRCENGRPWPTPSWTTSP